MGTILDLDQLGLIGSGSLDEVHFLKQEPTVGNDLFHLALLRRKLLLGSMTSLLASPFHLALDLMPLRRIRGITGAADTSELGRTHISDDTRSADYFRQRADLTGRLFECPADLLRVSQSFCADIDPVDEDQFRSGQNLCPSSVGSNTS